MRILALDTATSACTVAVADGENLLAELTLQVPRAHSTRLMPLVAQALEESGTARSDLQLIAAGVGPGSFTGLRIGLATTKGLAFALGIPCVGVSTLQALAYGTGAAAGLVVSMLDAKRGQVYAGIYAAGGREPDAWDELLPPSHLTVDRLAEEIRSLQAQRDEEPVILCGDAAVRYAPSLELGSAVQVAPPGTLLPRAWAVARLGEWQAQRGEQVQPEALLPCYLRKSEAEVLWDTRKSPSSP